MREAGPSVNRPHQRCGKVCFALPGVAASRSGPPTRLGHAPRLCRVRFPLISPTTAPLDSIMRSIFHRLIRPLSKCLACVSLSNAATVLLFALASWCSAGPLTAAPLAGPGRVCGDDQPRRHAGLLFDDPKVPICHLTSGFASNAELNRRLHQRAACKNALAIEKKRARISWSFAVKGATAAWCQMHSGRTIFSLSAPRGRPGLGTVGGRGRRLAHCAKFALGRRRSHSAA